MIYPLRVLIAINQLGAALLGGWPDEVMSSYAHRLHAAGKPFGWTRHVINWLFFWQDDHCRQAYEEEQRRYQMPPALR